jgi:hypothetical protein
LWEFKNDERFLEVIGWDEVGGWLGGCGLGVEGEGDGKWRKADIGKYELEG